MISKFFEDISKLRDIKLDKNHTKKIFKLISYMYLGYIHYSCETNLIPKKDGYFMREKSMLLHNFINLINELPWNIDQ
ncbi:hypothetical protein HERIO_1038 [Hepatospora eriocheir]|uniref:Uncharacterized protein n=1 Tax=Hepatospora eriocheir TaxID=1081669 RepID=A0A1X0QB98_9MICR|nr:hypothetical protein HERIO_1038 [Hepatospora eriocheir]